MRRRRVRESNKGRDKGGGSWLCPLSRMGKYMRKRGVGKTSPAVELGGVRTRARSAAIASASAAAAAAEGPAPKRPRKHATARAEAEAAVSGNGGAAAPEECCYLQLRSRRLFMPAGEAHCPVPPSPAAAVQRPGASGEPVEPENPGISRCSSTASSVDVVVLAMAPARERSGGEADEVREDCDVESVVSDSAVCRRQMRETTPSSRPPVDLSDEEWSQDTDDDPKRHRRRGTALATAATTTTAVACGRARMPPAAEIEEFFGAAEKAQAQRFTAKYNFDVARGLPLGAGRYEWTPVASS